MAKSIRARFELLNEEQAKAICLKDAALLSTAKASDFATANLLNYYTLGNCWLALIEQYSPNGWAYVRQYMLSNGMVALIKEFDDSAKALVAGDQMSSRLALMLYPDVIDALPLKGIQHDASKSIHDDPTAAMLQILRFGKRFSPLKADIVQSKSIDDFVQTQQRLKLLQHSEFSYYVIKHVKDCASKLVNWKSLTRKIRRMTSFDFEFTPGVTFETDSTQLSKMRYVADTSPWRLRQPFGIPLFSLKKAEVWEGYGHDRQYEVHTVKIVAVPKNYKSARIIAPENVIRQATARSMFRILDEFTPDGIHLHDQDVNATLAETGSVDGSLATIDLHAASDSITWPLLTSILPSRFCAEIAKVLPTHYCIGNKRYMLQTATTMGNSITFWVESVVFLAICKAAVQLYNKLSGDKDDRVSVYGDDIVVPSDAALLVMDFLNALGFIVNDDKTFASRDHLYRESCGHEYYNGIEVSSVFFPRFPLIGQLGKSFSNKHRFDAYTGEIITTMTAILDLQHKMFLSCDKASRIVTEIILEADPRMTRSIPELNAGDLWSYLDEPVVRLPLHEGKVDDETRAKWAEWGVLRELHSTPVLAKKNENRRSTSDEDELLLKLFQYEDFLRRGPRYEDDLLRILGVSAKPLSLDEAAGNTHVIWALTEK